MPTVPDAASTWLAPGGAGAARGGRPFALSPQFGKNDVVKTGDHAVSSAAAGRVEADATTRDLVARSILEHGPSTAAALAGRLDLTAAAIRRHLAVLVEFGHLDVRDQRVYGQRGRGRPAKVFFLTDAGRDQFEQRYEQIANEALAYLASKLGEGAVTDFADAVMAEIEADIESHPSDTSDREGTIAALVEVLNDRGYVASLQPVASGVQLCQYHCPVAHVARAHPELCAAETRVFSRLLDSHVQRLATIAHGDGVCTTHIPRPVERKVP